MIAVDWGTSSFRAYRLDDSGQIVDRRSASAGILTVTDGGFAETLENHVRDWFDSGERVLLLSGMIGSRQGWKEAPYASAPAGAEEIARALVPVNVRPGIDGWIVPGVVTVNADGIHDVMRGEETQILGILHDLGPGSHTLCLPGTHSKWVEVQHGTITGFRTFMTGEVFAVLKDHSILGRIMNSSAPYDRQAFADGLHRSADASGLLHHLFGVRAECLCGDLDAERSRDFLSGLLLGHELRQARGNAVVNLLGAGVLVDRYAYACEVLGRSTRILDPDAVVAGQWQIARSRRLV
ncbi:MAG: 2-dehydro-3-deoxygalactonokinase [Betaproteobacteria bacterium]|nr:2-dehydro-3-deoxygalactonokinase [Betaproteobacteria bacterium]